MFKLFYTLKIILEEIFLTDYQGECIIHVNGILMLYFSPENKLIENVSFNILFRFQMVS